MGKGDHCMSKIKKLCQGKYKVTNWSEYDNSLKQRGDLTIWFAEDAINNWLEKEVIDKNRRRQRKYSDLAIKTIYILRQVFHLRLRQAEGFVRSILKMLKTIMPIPDYTTISRRIGDVSINFITKITLR